MSQHVQRWGLVTLAAVVVGLGIAVGVPAAWAGDEVVAYDAAVSLMGEQRYPEAEAQFRQAITAEPRYKEAWQGLVVCLVAEGKADQAAPVAKVAAAPAVARTGTPPALSLEQQAALGLVPMTAAIQTALTEAARKPGDLELHLAAATAAAEAAKKAAAAQAAAAAAAQAAMPPVPAPESATVAPPAATATLPKPAVPAAVPAAQPPK